MNSVSSGISLSIPQTSASMEQIYHENKDQDGFLYTQYTGENVFGFSSVKNTNSVFSAFSGEDS